MEGGGWRVEGAGWRVQGGGSKMKGRGTGSRNEVDDAINRMRHQAVVLQNIPV